MQTNRKRENSDLAAKAVLQYSVSIAVVITVVQTPVNKSVKAGCIAERSLYFAKSSIAKPKRCIAVEVDLHVQIMLDCQTCRENQ